MDENLLESNMLATNVFFWNPAEYIHHVSVLLLYDEDTFTH